MAGDERDLVGECVLNFPERVKHLLGVGGSHGVALSFGELHVPGNPAAVEDRSCEVGRHRIEEAAVIGDVLQENRRRPRRGGEGQLRQALGLGGEETVFRCEEIPIGCSQIGTTKEQFGGNSSRNIGNDAGEGGAPVFQFGGGITAKQSLERALGIGVVLPSLDKIRLGIGLVRTTEVDVKRGNRAVVITCLG